MVAVTLAMLMLAPLQTAAPTARTLRPLGPTATPLTTVQRRDRMIADARALLARADSLRVGYTPANGRPTRDDLDRSVAETKARLDSMSEMGETESLRLQMAMDRMSKMMSTLSNLLKKASDTSSSITQNLK